MNAGDLKIKRSKQAPYLERTAGASCLHCPHGISEVRRCSGGLYGGSRAGHWGRLGRRLGHVRGHRGRLHAAGVEG